MAVAFMYGRSVSPDAKSSSYISLCMWCAAARRRLWQLAWLHCTRCLALPCLALHLQSCPTVPTAPERHVILGAVVCFAGSICLHTGAPAYLHGGHVGRWTTVVLVYRQGRVTHCKGFPPYAPPASVDSFLNPSSFTHGPAS